MLSEVSQTEQDMYYMISLIGGICRTKQTNKIETDSDKENRVIVARQVGFGGWVKKEEGLRSTNW